MRSKRTRRSIESKIVSSILWVGIVPLCLALAGGYVTARKWQERSTRRALLTTVEKTGQGLQIASRAYLNSVRELAAAPAITQFLQALEAGDGSHSALNERALERLRRQVLQSSITSPSIMLLFDKRGELVAGTGEAPAELSRPSEGVQILQSALFNQMHFDAKTQRFRAQLIAPVFAPDSGKRLGYVLELRDANELVRLALGMEMPGDTDEPTGDVLQIAYMDRGQLRVYSDVTVSAQMDAPPDPYLTDLFRKSGAQTSDSIRISNYPTKRGEKDVFLAYDTVFREGKVFVLAYRPVGEVFGPINWGTLAAAAFCSVVIATLCLSAYRNVHNSVVRNVLLVKQGAQIIGQGDLKLKLRIATGDEIEELATSFNKMAQALRQNIRQLEESEEKYRGLVDSMLDGIVQTDTEGVIGLINPSGARICGFSRVGDVVGKNLRELFPGTHEFVTVVRNLREKGLVERNRIWVVRRDGRRMCLEVSGNLLHDSEYGIVGMEGIFRDVTKEVLLEHEVHERAERIGTINMIANVINSNLESGRLYDSLVVELKKVVDFDYASLSLLDEMRGLFEVRRLWPEQDEIPSRQCKVRDEDWGAPIVLRTQQCLVVDDLKRPDSVPLKDFPEEVRSCLCVPLYAVGRIIGTLNLGLVAPSALSRHDIEVLEQIAPHIAVAIRNAQLLDNLKASLDEVTRARERLHEANKELMTLDEMKTNLLSNVSHELRTPLVAVLGYTDIIYNGKVGPINDVQKEYLGIGLRNIEKLVTLIENLLDFSRLHQGTETLEFNTFNLADCARTSIEIVGPLTESREITVALAAPDEPVLVEGDKGKIGQVFNNLLSNAAKFSHQGGRVTVEIRPSQDSVEAIVSDEGIGIPAEAQDRIFSRFYQYDSSTTRKYGGTGIGLAIAQDIVRLHGSRITVTSEVGKGSTFRFSLPLKKEDSTGPEADVTVPADTIEVPEESEEAVSLVVTVTQDRSLSSQIRSLLEPEGTGVVTASSLARTLSLVRSHHPDCVIVDLEAGAAEERILPGLLSEPAMRDVPIVVLTGNDEVYAEYRDRVATRLKPGFRKSTLLSSVHYALGYRAGAPEPLGERILCVDDDPEVVTFITRCLEAEGWELDHCGSGEDALDRVAGREYGLVLLDIAMPGMDGFEACRRLKSDPALAGIQICIVTAKPRSTIEPRLEDSGADACLFKPFKAEDLLQVVRDSGLKPVRAPLSTPSERQN